MLVIKNMTCFVPSTSLVLTVPIERLPGGELALAGRRVARGGGRGLAVTSPTMSVDAAAVPHFLLLLLILLLKVLLLLGASKVGHVAGQGR